MCSKPKIPEQQQWQAAQAPVYNESQDDEENLRRGRRGTIAAGAMDTASSGGKTRLGQ